MKLPGMEFLSRHIGGPARNAANLARFIVIINAIIIIPGYLYFILNLIIFHFRTYGLSIAVLYLPLLLEIWLFFPSFAGLFISLSLGLSFIFLRSNRIRVAELYLVHSAVFVAFLMSLIADGCWLLGAFGTFH